MHGPALLGSFLVQGVLELVLPPLLLHLVEYRLGDRHHHGGSGRVADPHGQEGCGQHEAQHQPEAMRREKKVRAKSLGRFQRDGHDVMTVTIPW